MTTAAPKQSELQKIEAKAMSFLKAAEHDAAVVIEDVAAVGAKVAPEAELGAAALGYPEVSMAIQKIFSLITGAGAIVNTATNGTGSGADKLAIAAPAVEKLITGSGVFGKAVVADVNKYDNAIKVITGGFADLMDAHALALPAATAPAAAATAAAPAATAASSQETLASALGV